MCKIDEVSSLKFKINYLRKIYCKRSNEINKSTLPLWCNDMFLFCFFLSPILHPGLYANECCIGHLFLISRKARNSEFECLILDILDILVHVLIEDFG